jgi:GTP-binding protein
MLNSLRRCFAAAKPHQVHVSLIGKPNVGKSTIFNKLSLTDAALVHPTPGLTRDGKSLTVYKTLKVPVCLQDTPGIQFLLDGTKPILEHYVMPNSSEYEPADIKELAKDMFDKTKVSIQESDCVLFIVDCKTGINRDDRTIANWLKKNYPNKAVFLIGNKADSEETEIDSYNDVYSLGFEKVSFVSAETGNNMHAIWEIIDSFIDEAKIEAFKQTIKSRKERINEYKVKFLDEIKTKAAENKNFKLVPKELSHEFDYLNRDLIYADELDNPKVNLDNIILLPKVIEKSGISYYNRFKNLPIKIALVGRPNSGKSTLFNRLIGFNKSLTHHIAHTTKDANSHFFTWKGRRIELIDTAGLQRNLMEDPREADYSVFFRTLNELRMAQIHILMVDAMNAFRVKDLEIIQQSAKEGRGLILFVNKWDMVDEKWHAKAKRYMQQQISHAMGSERSAPLIFASALKGEGVDNLMDLVLGVYENWNARISTGMLNDWLQRFKKLSENDYESLVKRQTILKIRYVTQIKSRPPTFAVFVNNVEFFKPHILKFIKTKLVEEFKLQGVPIRLLAKPADKIEFRRRILTFMRS